MDDEVALGVHLEPVAEDIRVRPVADRHEQALGGHRAFLVRLGVPEAQSLDVRVAQDLLDGRVEVDLDLGVLVGPVDHDLAAPELVAPVEQVDLRGEAGQVGGLLEGRIAAADDRDLLVPEEEPVAGRARRHAAAAEAFLTGQAEPHRRCAGRDDDGLGAVFDPAGPDAERALPEVDPVHVHVEDPRPEPLRLGAERGHEIGTLDPVREARVVLDVAREHQLAAGRRAGDDDGREVRPCRVDRRREAGRPGADDDHGRFDRPRRLAVHARADGCRRRGAERDRGAGAGDRAGVGARPRRCAEVDGEARRLRGRGTFGHGVIVARRPYPRGVSADGSSDGRSRALRGPGAGGRSPRRSPRAGRGRSGPGSG